jgi:hypothetical protein
MCCCCDKPLFGREVLYVQLVGVDSYGRAMFYYYVDADVRAQCDGVSNGRAIRTKKDIQESLQDSCHE